MNETRDLRPRGWAALPLTATALPPLLGGALTLVIVSLVAAAFDPSALTRRLLAPVGGLYIRAVPAATLFLFLWTMIDLTLKARELMEEDRALREAEERGAPDLARELADADPRTSPIYRRLLAPLRPLLAGAEVADCHEVFRHHAEIEATESARRYTLVRVFIWAMPILGFIGTVIGIGIAVGEFSGFLTGNIEDLERVKAELSKVSTGLSFAFDTTLLGLLASLVAMLTVSAVQAREERLLSRAESFALNVLARIPVRARPLAAVPVRASAAEVVVPTEAEALVATVGASSTALTDAVSGVPGVLGRLDGQIAALREAIDAHREAMSSDKRIEEAAALIGEASKTHREALNRLGMLPEITGALRAIGASVTGQTEQLRSLAVVTEELRRLTAAQQTTAEELTTIAPGIEAVRDLLVAEQRRFTDAMSSVPEALTRLDGQIAALRDAVGVHRDVLSGSGRIEQMIGLMAEAGKSHREALDRLEELPELTGGLQAIAASVAEQTGQLRSLTGVVGELRGLTSAQQGTVEELAAIALAVGVLRDIFSTEQQTITMLGSLASIPHQIQQLGSAYEDASRKLAGLARIPEEVRHAIETHEATIGQMRSFEAVLGKLAETVGRSSRVLESLSTPLEFRVVAAPRDGNGEKK